MRISLDEREFSELVNGRAIQTNAVGNKSGEVIEILLADIGFARMRELIAAAENGETNHGSQTETS